MHRILPFLLLAACTPPADEVSDDTDPPGTARDAYEGDAAGECTDGADGDRDGRFDCDDEGCAGAPACADDSDGPVGNDSDPPDDTDVYDPDRADLGCSFEVRSHRFGLIDSAWVDTLPVQVSFYDPAEGVVGFRLLRVPGLQEVPLRNPVWSRVDHRAYVLPAEDLVPEATYRLEVFDGCGATERFEATAASEPPAIDDDDVTGFAWSHFDFAEYQNTAYQVHDAAALPPLGRRGRILAPKVPVLTLLGDAADPSPLWFWTGEYAVTMAKNACLSTFALDGVGERVGSRLRVRATSGGHERARVVRATASGTFTAGGKQLHLYHHLVVDVGAATSHPLVCELDEEPCFPCDHDPARRCVEDIVIGKLARHPTRGTLEPRTKAQIDADPACR